MLLLSSSARRMRTLSVYNGSRQGVSKNSQHFSPPTSKSYYIVVLPFFVFCKGCLTLLARSLCKHWCFCSDVRWFWSWRRKWVGSFSTYPNCTLTDLPSQCRAQRLLHRNPLRCLREGRFKFSRVCARNKWAGINMLMFHVDITLKQLKIRFKNDSFSWLGVNSFFWKTITLYTVHF